MLLLSFGAGVDVLEDGMVGLGWVGELMAFLDLAGYSSGASTGWMSRGKGDMDWSHCMLSSL